MADKTKKVFAQEINWYSYFKIHGAALPYIETTLGVCLIKESHDGGSERDDSCYRCLTLTARSIIWGSIGFSYTKINRLFAYMKFSIF